MLDQVARTSREYPVLPGTTEDQGVLWHMSTVLLTAFGFLYVATPFRPPLHREGREHIPQERRGATLVPVPARCVEAHRGMQRRAGEAHVHQPTRTTANRRECCQRQKGDFAGISEHQRTATTSWI